MSSVDSQWLTMLSHCLLSQLNESLLVWRSWAWKELNVAVLRAEHIADQDSIDVVLRDDRALDLGKVESKAKSRLIEFSLVANGLGDVAYRVLGDGSSLGLSHSRIC